MSSSHAGAASMLKLAQIKDNFNVMIHAAQGIGVAVKNIGAALLLSVLDHPRHDHPAIPAVLDFVGDLIEVGQHALFALSLYVSGRTLY